MWLIYKISNIKTQEYYIGITSLDIKERFQYHWSLSRRVKKFNPTIWLLALYLSDKKDWITEVLEDGLDKATAYQKEKALIISNQNDKLCLNTEHKLQKRSYNPGPVRHIPTNKVYKDLKDLCRKCGIRLSSVQGQLRIKGYIYNLIELV